MYKYGLEKLRKYFKESEVKTEENPELSRFKKMLLECSKSMNDEEMLESIKRDLRKTRLPKNIERDLEKLSKKI